MAVIEGNLAMEDLHNEASKQGELVTRRAGIQWRSFGPHVDHGW